MDGLLNLTWLIDIAHTDNASKEINMAEYKALLIRVLYNGFSQHVIYPKGILSTTHTKLINVEPLNDYYCIARITSDYNNTTGIAHIRLANMVRHLESIPATVSIYGVK